MSFSNYLGETAIPEAMSTCDVEKLAFSFIATLCYLALTADIVLRLSQNLEQYPPTGLKPEISYSKKRFLTA